MQVLLPNQANTTELVNRCKAGDKSAFALLYDKYAKSMFNTCIRICANYEDAQDIVQESFTLAFSKLLNLKNPEAVGGWLHAIVINKTISHVRKSEGKQVLFVEESSRGNQPSADDEGAEPEYTVEEVLRAVKQLPKGYRLVLCLYLFEEMSHKEIAEKLGITESTSKSQYARAKQAVVKCILSNKNQNV